MEEKFIYIKHEKAPLKGGYPPFWKLFWTFSGLMQDSKENSWCILGRGGWSNFSLKNFIYSNIKLLEFVSILSLNMLMLWTYENHMNEFVKSVCL